MTLRAKPLPDGTGVFVLSHSEPACAFEQKSKYFESRVLSRQFIPRLTRAVREALTSLFVPMLNEPKDAPPWLFEGVEKAPCTGVLCTGGTNLGLEGSRGVS